MTAGEREEFAKALTLISRATSRLAYSLRRGDTLGSILECSGLFRARYEDLAPMLRAILDDAREQRGTLPPR